MRPELVRFSSFDHPFRVRWQQCRNLECACTEVNFTFTEIADSGFPVGDPLQFVVSVDPETWQESEVKSTERPASVNEAVRCRL